MNGWKIAAHVLAGLLLFAFAAMTIWTWLVLATPLP